MYSFPPFLKLSVDIMSLLISLFKVEGLCLQKTGRSESRSSVSDNALPAQYLAKFQ